MRPSLFLLSVETGIRIMYCKNISGAGQIGMAIARRMGYGMKIVIGDKKTEHAEAVSRMMNGMCTINIGTDVDTRLYRAYSWAKRERACSSILPGTRRTIFSSLVATDRGGMPA